MTKQDDFIEDVQSLIKQYGLTPESLNQIETINEMIYDYEGKIHLYKGLIEGCKTSITVWNNVAKKIMIDSKQALTNK